MDFNSSANMNLPVPTVSVAPGPAWAALLNSCLTIIDSHSHTAGSGVPITSAALDINGDVSFANNNLTNPRSVRFSAQGSPLALGTDLGCIYVAGVDLYYNDVDGNQIQITDAGGVAGTPGSIANLTSPASASYVSGTSTFVWQSAANTPANMDLASLLLRNLSAGSNALTLQPPAAMGSNYSLTLPTIPVSQKFMTLDNTGAMSAPWAVDDSTIEVSSNIVQVKDGGITPQKLSPLGQQISANIANGASSGSVGVFADIASMSVTITTTGRPVFIGVIGGDPNADSNIGAYFSPFSGSSGAPSVAYRFIRGATPLARHSLMVNANTDNAVDKYVMLPANLFHIDTPSAGTYTYKLQGATLNTNVGNATFIATNIKLIAYEL